MQHSKNGFGKRAGYSTRPARNDRNGPRVGEDDVDGQALQTTMRERALWVLSIVLSMALLLAPALWNGFPLLEYDTGGYLARWYEHSLVISRAVVYGLMLNAGTSLAFWPVLVLQAALTVWLIALVLRAHRLGGRPLLLLGIVAALTVFTTLPWLTS